MEHFNFTPLFTELLSKYRKSQIELVRLRIEVSERERMINDLLDQMERIAKEQCD